MDLGNKVKYWGIGEHQHQCSLRVSIGTYIVLTWLGKSIVLLCSDLVCTGQLQANGTLHNNHHAIQHLAETSRCKMDQLCGKPR